MSTQPAKMRLTVVVAALAAVLATATTASADHFQYTREPQLDYHDNVSAWDLADFMTRTGGSYASGLQIDVVVGGCDQANQNNDANCLATWNGAADHAIASWNNQTSARPGPTPFFYRRSYNTALYDPCTVPNAAFAGAVILCYDLNSSQAGYWAATFRLSHGAWHLYGGKVALNQNCWLTTIRFRNCATHELGHALGLGHRGTYGYDDPMSGQYHTDDPSVTVGPRSIMDIAPTDQYIWPDTHDIDLAVLLNGGYVNIAGTNYCLEDHTGQCPGVNLRFDH